MHIMQPAMTRRAMLLAPTSDRLVNDEKVLQALAQMFARIGVQAEVDAMASTAFFPRVGRQEFSFFFNSWGAGSSGGMTTMRTALVSYDDARGMGRGNRGRYSNAEVDRRIIAAPETIDDSMREQLLREATRIAKADVAVIPTHWTMNDWASKSGVSHEPRVDGFTPAPRMRPTA